MANTGVMRGVGMTNPLPSKPGTTNMILTKNTTSEGSVAWTNAPVVLTLEQRTAPNAGFSLLGALFGASGIFFGASGLSSAADTWMLRSSAGVISVVNAFSIGGLTGATGGSRWVGGTTGSPPTTGTFAAGDFITTTTGQMWICTTAGSPGTWYQAGKAVTSFGSSGSLQSTAAVAITTNIANVWPNASSCAITLNTTTGVADGDTKTVRIYGACTTLSWVNTSSAAATAPTTNAAASTSPLTVGFQWDAQNGKWRCVAVS